jgi:hypothetical protein
MRQWMNLFEAYRGLEFDNDDYDEAEEKLNDYDHDDAPGFEILRHAEDRHDKLRPLMIVVHPGDMMETDDGWGDREQGRKAIAFSKRNIAGTTREIAAAHKKNYDILIIHRPSCSQIVNGQMGDDFHAEILIGWKRGSVVFGDDLAEVVKWIVANLHIEDRPMIYMAGAYSDPEYGCLTYVGRALEKIVGPKRIRVSRYSPPSASPDDPVWVPGT